VEAALDDFRNLAAQSSTDEQRGMPVLVGIEIRITNRMNVRDPARCSHCDANHGADARRITAS